MPVPRSRRALRQSTREGGSGLPLACLGNSGLRPVRTLLQGAPTVGGCVEGGADASVDMCGRLAGGAPDASVGNRHRLDQGSHCLHCPVLLIILTVVRLLSANVSKQRGPGWATDGVGWVGWPPRGAGGAEEDEVQEDASLYVLYSPVCEISGSSNFLASGVSLPERS